MSTLAPDLARAQIADLLSDTVYHALGLKETLADERKALESQDMDDIDAAVDSKTASVLKLQTLDNKRLQLCSSADSIKAPIKCRS